MTMAEAREILDPMLIALAIALVIMGLCAYFLQSGCPPEE